MWHIQKTGPVATRAIRGVLAALILAGTCALTPSAARADAVDELRQALLADKLELGGGGRLGTEPASEVTDFRRENLQKKVKDLKTIGDLWNALALKDWKDLDAKASKKVREIDCEARQQVGNRLTKAIQAAVERGNVNRRLAVASSIAEKGPTVRSLSVLKGDTVIDGDPAGYVHSLAPQVKKLSEDENLGVREQALRALGTIFPEPRMAVPVFQKALETDAVGPKRRAAEGLGQLIRVVSYLRNQGRGSVAVEASRKDVLETVATVMGGNSAGLGDDDAEVRTRCLQNIQVAADALADLTLKGLVAESSIDFKGPEKDFPSDGRKDFPPEGRKDFPPEGRKWTGEENKYVLGIHEIVAGELAEFAPVIKALRSQGPALARSLKDPNASIRLAAADALESIGNARIRLKKRVASVPVVPGEAGGDRGNREFLAKNDPLEDFMGENLALITNLLGERDVSLRRKAVEFLDIIEEAAIPALPWLAKALCDPDRMVRWSAARAIANIGPDKASVAIPGLIKLLSDPDLNVKIAAAKTLKEMGPAAQSAVRALAIAANSGDVEARLPAMEALRIIAVGSEQAKLAVPQLIEALKYKDDARVRALAAKTLGELGPAALPAIPVLRNAIGDDDQDVRTNASDAILAIDQREKA